MPWPSQRLNIGGSVAGSILIFMLVFAFQQPCQRMVAAVVQARAPSALILLGVLAILVGGVSTLRFQCCSRCSRRHLSRH